MVHTTTPSQANAALKLRFGRFEIDEAEARLLDDGEPMHLAPKPFAVLCALARMPHTLVTKSALLDQVWGHQFVSESVLKTTISDVRAVLDDDPRQPRFIETLSRRGYRFIGAVAPAAAPEPLLQPIAIVAPAPSDDAPVIGRVQPLERLRQAWRAAAAGTRQVVWIAGEAGVGKTTLIEHFMREVGDASCAHGQCVANGAEPEPGLPILEALTGLSRRDPAFVQLMRQVAPTWLSRMPWLCTPVEREALQRELADAGQARMLREMGELLDRYSAQRPLLLITEDLHWADQTTVQLIDYVARRRSGARLMWLASFRMTELIAADHPLATLRHELRLHRLAREIVLEAFSPAEVAEYVALRAPALAANVAVVEALCERTDGLPLLLANVVDELVAPCAGDGAQQSPAHERVASTATPETLIGLVERYLQEITPRQRALLEAASVCGARFRVSMLARALEADVSGVAAACAELARRRRWIREASDGQHDAGPDAVYEFHQGVYREVLYKRLDPLTRTELQRRVMAAPERHERTTRPRVVRMPSGGRYASLAHATA